MNEVTVADAKILLANGVLTGAHIQPVPMSDDWSVVLQHREGQHLALFDRRTQSARRFKSIDAAHRAIRDIGFQAESFRVVF
jgi:transposase